jgi:hypothetical protein
MQIAINFSLASPRLPGIGTDCHRVLDMLLHAGDAGITNIEFCDAHLANFRSRLSELRRIGWTIPKGERVTAGVWKYRLIRMAEACR